MTLLEDKFEILEEKSDMLKTLGHPIRLSIVDILSSTEQLTVTEIYQTLGIEQAVASHHLRIMKNASIVKASKRGKNTFYKIADPQITQLFQILFPA